MLKFPRQITTEFFEYSTALALETFVGEVEKLIDKKWYDTNINIDVKKTGNNEFTITTKWKVVGSDDWRVKFFKYKYAGKSEDFCF